MLLTAQCGRGAAGDLDLRRLIVDVGGCPADDAVQARLVEQVAVDDVGRADADVEQLLRGVAACAAVADDADAELTESALDILAPDEHLAVEPLLAVAA